MPEEKVKYFEAVGKRKTARARVRISPASKTSYEINGKAGDVYFPGEGQARTIREPLVTAGVDQKFKITARITGGGTKAQLEALKLGLARSLTKFDIGLRSSLKKALLLRRDPRIKERRKFGLKKARKAPQWSKR